MEGEFRRNKILEVLQQETKPVSASKFADKLGVSRQIIVGDVALLRAAGEEITATSRGYVLKVKNDLLISKIVVQHSAEQTEEELTAIVGAGGQVVDVIVEHPLYGELTGGLHIKNQEDVQNFIAQFNETKTSLLSELTNGIHLHTVAYEEPEDLNRIKAVLAEKGILYLQ